MHLARRAGVLLSVATASLLLASVSLADHPAEYVIHISVDGCSPFYLQPMIDKGELPAFKRFQTDGAWTNHARTDFDFTVTLPNHTCMLTGRPVRDRKGPTAAIAGHLWTENGEPGDKTLHGNCKSYVKSTFDVAHDNGLSTSMYATKTKFILYDQSYNAANGAPDTVMPDNGRDKIDTCFIDENSYLMTAKFIVAMSDKPFNYSFVHFRGPDTAGHADSWGSPEYLEALRKVDRYLSLIFELVTTNSKLKDKTTIILSADHGGVGKDHGTNTDPVNYTIPFYTWGAGVSRGSDLYRLNPTTRQQPGRPDYVLANLQPIRNGDGGNLALSLLGLGPIPESYINAAQDLRLITDKEAKEIKEKAEKDAKEAKAKEEKEAKEKAEKEAKEKAAKEKEAKEKEAKDKEAKEKAEKEAKEKEAKDKEAKEKEAKGSK